MFVTTLIKDTKYRQFILQRFPKPNGQKNHKSILSTYNNPSLLGNAIEVFIKLTLARKINTINLNAEFELISSNIDWYLKKENLIYDSNEIRYFITKNDNLTKAKKIIKEVFASETFQITNRNRVKGLEVFKFTFSDLMKIYSEIPLPINKISGLKPFVIESKEDSDKYIVDKQYVIKKDIETFIVNGKVTVQLINSIFQFTKLSSQFFPSAPTLSLQISKEIMSELKIHLTSLSNKIMVSDWQRVIFKPDLSWKKIRARPDLLINNCIYEIKCSKSYLSTDNYLQCMTYLIFAGQRINPEKFEQVEKAILYYPLLDKTYEINSSTTKLRQPDEKRFNRMLDNFVKNGRC